MGILACIVAVVIFFLFSHRSVFTRARRGVYFTDPGAPVEPLLPRLRFPKICFTCPCSACSPLIILIFSLISCSSRIAAHQSVAEKQVVRAIAIVYANQYLSQSQFSGSRHSKSLAVSMLKLRSSKKSSKEAGNSKTTKLQKRVGNGCLIWEEPFLLVEKGKERGLSCL